MINILTMELRFEQDLVAVRQRTRQIAQLIGFDQQSQTRITTAVSEISRNAFRYAIGARALFAVDGEVKQFLRIFIEDKGPGISNLDSILSGAYHSQSGMGLGIIGARRLMDHFEIESAASGTKIVIAKAVPAGRLKSADIAAISEALARNVPEDAWSEIRQQNAELMQALALVEKRELELSRLNQELADTNRGVIALNAELEDQAIAVRRASEVKSHFLTHMTHEFRTPVNSILSLSRVLLSPSTQDPLSPERLRQVGFIRKAAESLSELVNDILDTAKAEAGRLEVRAGSVDLTEFFGALRAMFRPLLAVDKPVELIFELPEEPSLLFTDEGKLSQILRNFISNALKFTDEGEVRVRAEFADDDMIHFSVTDTGIGIKESDQLRVFEDFTQIESPHQRLAKGTGLGLPLARRLAILLGGRVSLRSEFGRGSTFTVSLPKRLAGYPLAAITGPLKILIIADDEISRYVLANLLKDPRFEIVEASDGPEGISLAKNLRPQAIFLDLRMPRMSGFEVFAALTNDPGTQMIPVIISSSKKVKVEDFKAYDRKPVVILSKDDFSCEDATERIHRALGEAGLLGSSLEAKDATL